MRVVYRRAVPGAKGLRVPLFTEVRGESEGEREVQERCI